MEKMRNAKFKTGRDLATPLATMSGFRGPASRGPFRLALLPPQGRGLIRRRCFHQDDKSTPPQIALKRVLSVTPSLSPGCYVFV
jgi:hypothetical protein